MTPSIASGILAGITREAVIEIARAEHLEVFEREVTPEELAAADEAFLTNSLVEVEDKPVGSGRQGKLTQRLSAGYAALVQAEGSGAEASPEG